MSIESDLHEAMLQLYQRAGREVGYWANYYLREVQDRAVGRGPIRTHVVDAERGQTDDSRRCAE